MKRKKKTKKPAKGLLVLKGEYTKKELDAVRTLWRALVNDKKGDFLVGAILKSR